MAVAPADLARELMKRRKAELGSALERRDEVRKRVEGEVRSLLAEGCASRAWLVGSLAWGNFGERSDVDVVFAGLSPDRVGAVAARLEERTATVADVLRFEDLDDGFRQRVIDDGVEIGP